MSTQPYCQTEPTDDQLAKETADREQLAQVVEDALAGILTASKLIHAHDIPRWTRRLAPPVVQAVWDWLDPTA